MKKILFIILILIPTLSFSQENILNIYENFLSNLDKTKYYSTSIGIIKYKELFSDSPTSLKDEAFVLFNSFYNDVTEQINESAIDYYVYFNNQSQNEILTKHKKDLNDNGFDIAMDEISYLKRDYNYIFQNFSPFVSSEMKTYILLLNSYENEGTISDGTLTISPTRLAERLIDLNFFIQTNPSFLMIEDCKAYEKWFFTLLLKGTSNSPLLNDDDSISESFLNAYLFVFLKYPNSKVEIYLKPYYNLLKQKNKEKTTNLLELYQQGGVIEN